MKLKAGSVVVHVQDRDSQRDLGLCQGPIRIFGQCCELHELHEVIFSDIFSHSFFPPELLATSRHWSPEIVWRLMKAIRFWGASSKVSNQERTSNLNAARQVHLQCLYLDYIVSTESEGPHLHVWSTDLSKILFACATKGRQPPNIPLTFLQICSIWGEVSPHSIRPKPC